MQVDICGSSSSSKQQQQKIKAKENTADSPEVGFGFCGAYRVADRDLYARHGIIALDAYIYKYIFKNSVYI